MTENMQEYPHINHYLINQLKHLELHQYIIFFYNWSGLHYFWYYLQTNVQEIVLCLNRDSTSLFIERDDSTFIDKRPRDELIFLFLLNNKENSKIDAKKDELQLGSTPVDFKICNDTWRQHVCLFLAKKVRSNGGDSSDLARVTRKTVGMGGT